MAIFVKNIEVTIQDYEQNSKCTNALKLLL